MSNLSIAGRIFYGIAMAGMGVLTIYYSDFPYMLLPPKHAWIPNLTMFAYISGALLTVAGTCICFGIKTRVMTLALGSVLLLIFCFYYIPYQFMTPLRYANFLQWENAEKELALSGGAFVIAGCYSTLRQAQGLKRLGRFGAICYSIIIIIFGTLHFLYAKDASTLVPAWIPKPLFWTYLAGIGLIGPGIAIILKIKLRLFAGLLGAMIFTWFIILHIPRVIASPFADKGSEITSAFLALAYSGIALFIAGAEDKHDKASPHS